MPVITRCPMCRAIMPPSRGETHCPRCGEAVVPVPRKLCAGCGLDVSIQKRVKDPATGEYYCHTCWSESRGRAADDVTYACCRCGGTFPFRDVFQATEGIVCRGCRSGGRGAARTARADAAADPDELDPDTLLVAAARMEGSHNVVFDPGGTVLYRRPEGVPRVWVALGVAVLVALVVLIVVVTTSG